MKTVLHVSRVARAIEFEFFVTVTPLALKHAMLSMNRTHVIATHLLSAICYRAKIASSTRPFEQYVSEAHGM